MKITRQGLRYIADSKYSEKDVLKNGGFKWDAILKHWYTTDSRIAEKFASYCDDDIRDAIKKLRDEKEKVIESSLATSADIEIPAPENLKYLPFQKAGIKYMCERKNTLLADSMGLGKTIEIIGYMNINPDVKKVLIICPASLRLNWLKELNKWLINKNLTMSVIKGGVNYTDADIVIINYDVVDDHYETISKIEWDLLVCDEAHYMKNYKAKRTQHIVGYYNSKNPEKSIAPINAKRNIFATGTPILNRPIELWTLAHFLDRKMFSSVIYFKKRYCGSEQTRYGTTSNGATNTKELQEKLRSTIMIRRLKEDVLKELPPKTRQVIEIPANGCASLIKKEQDMYSKHQEVIETLRVAVELAKASDDINDYIEAVNALKSASSVAFTEMAKIRHEIGIAKIPYVIEHIHNALESSNKIVVFGWHNDTISAIENQFKDICVKIVGDTTLEKREEAVTKFQTDDNVKLFIGNIKAAGVGITLTASSHVIFAEAEWVPSNLTQAEDRTHRIGQTENVLIQHLVLEGSLDSYMVQTVVEKQAIIDKILDNYEIEDYVLPEKASEKPATGTATKSDIEKES